MMVSFTDHYNAISMTDSLQKQKLEKVHGAWIILFYVRPSSSQLQSCFKENSKILSKNFTTQIKYYNFKEFAFLLKTHKTTTLQQVTGGKIPNLVLKKMLERFLKIQPPKKILEFQYWKKPAKLISKRKLQTRIVYEIGAKLVSNYEQNMSYK